jgi:pantetheine-phosphate adenylyltransferase
MRAVCPGSFDPITRGHLDVIERAASCFEHVLVAVGQNSAKSHLFTAAERLELATIACADLSNVSIAPLDGLLVDFCVAHDAPLVVKGARTSGDFEYELQMAQWNRSLRGVETVLFPTSPQWTFLSSTKVREVALLGGDVRPYVPPIVAERIEQRLAERATAQRKGVG